MLHISAAVRGLILAVLLTGVALSVPNLFYERVERHNDAVAEIEALGATPEREADAALWPSFLPSGLVNLGLDLRGGAYLLAEVAVEDVHAERMDGLWPDLRDALRAERATVGAIRRIESAPDELRVRIETPEGMPAAMEAARGLAQPVVSLTGVGRQTVEVAE